MNNLWTIYKYEIKKVVSRKSFWITSLICVICIVLTTCSGLIGTYYVDGKPIESNYEAVLKDQAYRRALSGRVIDNLLLQETVEAYSHVPTDVYRYTLTEEYETYARAYSDIFNLIRAWTGMNLTDIKKWRVDENDLYEARMKQLESDWQSIPLMEIEKEYWRAKEKEINKPFVYYYHEGYEIILNSFLTIGIVMLLFVAICLSNLFADEHLRRTDQLVLSSIIGKKQAYWAKLLAGVTVSVVVAIIMSLLTMGLCLMIYGSEGFEMSLQSCISMYSYPISIGEACLIAYGILIIASILVAIFVMVMSEVFQSGVIALALSTCLIILGNVITIPTQYRIIAQIWDSLPMAYLATWNVFDPRTIVLFNKCFPSWQVIPLIYILLSVVLAILGNNFYKKYQVNGR